jgi:hypothetical protein
MTQYSGFFAPSERALEFGGRYAEVLARWGEMFAAASALVASNVELGRSASDGAKEFETWLRQTATAPWNLLSPEVIQRFMQGVAGSQGPQGS